MDRPIDELELNWDLINPNADLFEAGKKNEDTIVAKMIRMAYEEGYDAGYTDSEEERNEMEYNLSIMLTQPAGHA